ncbi:MAG: hypothetical protein A2Z96_04115 [Spirochaetes bacterium GWB1_48_6]|nr:MAG: hypothetical protein A2Z96_04115 [Spirochaetes bacterium GWB1_48_6]
MKSFKYLSGLLIDSTRLILLYFWFGFFPGNWNQGSEVNLFFLFLIGPQVIFPLGWINAHLNPLPEPFRLLALSVRQAVLGIEIFAGLWLFFTLSLVPWYSLSRPEFILTLLIALADLAIIILLKSLPTTGTSDSGE